ncbi:MAG: hypothetical protein GX134_15860 [candidate division WS1 bacterium]|jgi:hypothetical protein|nr:hypothetical protein [candidate division WS1 bacterium]
MKKRTIVLMVAAALVALALSIAAGCAGGQAGTDLGGPDPADVGRKTVRFDMSIPTEAGARGTVKDAVSGVGLESNAATMAWDSPILSGSVRVLNETGATMYDTQTRVVELESDSTASWPSFTFVVEVSWYESSHSGTPTQSLSPINGYGIDDVNWNYGDVPNNQTSDDATWLTWNFTAPSLFRGYVTNLINGVAMPGVEVAVSALGLTDVTDAAGMYEFSGIGSTVARRVVASTGTIERSFEANLAPSGSQDITVLPDDYNTTFLRAMSFHDSGVVLRWPVGMSPTIVAYRYKYQTGTDRVPVSDSMWNAILDVLNNELVGLSEGFYGAPKVEIFDGRPEDDSRWKPSGDYWGYMIGSVGIAVSDFLGEGVAGLGGCGWYSDYSLALGGAVVLDDGGGYSDFRHVVEHELGHALGWAHPFSRLNPSDPLMRPSVMNYQGSGNWSMLYSDADRETMRFYMHRPQGNAAPDKDPNGFVGYRAEGPIEGGVYIDRFKEGVAERINFKIVDGAHTWIDDPSSLYPKP